MCLQVGALEPNAHEDLKTTLLITHPHEDVVYKQGSYLSATAIAALAEMQTHAELLEAQQLIKQRMLQLVNAADRLRASRTQVVVPAGGRASTDTAASSSLGACVGNLDAGHFSVDSVMTV